MFTYPKSRKMFALPLDSLCPLWGSLQLVVYGVSENEQYLKKRKRIVNKFSSENAKLLKSSYMQYSKQAQKLFASSDAYVVEWLYYHI